MDSKTDNYNELVTIIENLKKVINEQNEKTPTQDFATPRASRR